MLKEQGKYAFKLPFQDIPEQRGVQEDRETVYWGSPTPPEDFLLQQLLLHQYSMQTPYSISKGVLMLTTLLCMGEFPITYTKHYLCGRFWNKMEPAWNNTLILAAGCSICSWRRCLSVSLFVLVSLSPWMQRGSCWSYWVVSNSSLNPE